MKYLKSLSIAATLAASIAIPASADTELTMYYPIAVGGSLTQVVDGIVADFEAENPDIKVNAVYSGNYDDTRVRVRPSPSSSHATRSAIATGITGVGIATSSSSTIVKQPVPPSAIGNSTRAYTICE